MNAHLDLTEELELAVRACRAAGVAVARLYDSPGEVWRKEDSSPLTRADLEANRIIVQLLQERFPEDGLLSEETRDDGSRLRRPRVWVVDPLDGTRDFVGRTGEFAVLVGLAVGGVPVLGVAHRPVGDVLYRAVTGGGAFRESAGRTEPLRVSAGGGRLGVTRFARTSALGRLEAESAGELLLAPMGACIKMLAVAEGTLQATVCLHGREKEWDTCAPEVIVREAGGEVSDLDGRPFRYNKPDVRHHRGIVMSAAGHSTWVRRLAPYFER